MGSRGQSSGIGRGGISSFGSRKEKIVQFLMANNSSLTKEQANEKFQKILENYTQKANGNKEDALNMWEENINTLKGEKKKTSSQRLKEAKEKAEQKAMDSFYGKNNTKKISNKYFTYKHAIDNDNVIVTTQNVSYWTNKNTYVMHTGNDKITYLKESQVRKVHNYEEGIIDAYNVKLNRKSYKQYNSKYESGKYSFDKDQTFDDFVKIAKEQDKQNMKVAKGHMYNYDDVTKQYYY